MANIYDEMTELDKAKAHRLAARQALGAMNNALQMHQSIMAQQGKIANLETILEIAKMHAMTAVAQSNIGLLCVQIRSYQEIWGVEDEGIPRDPEQIEGIGGNEEDSEGTEKISRFSTEAASDSPVNSG